MNRRLAVSALMLTSVFSVTNAFASSVHLTQLVDAKLGKTKLIRFSLRNDSSQPVTIVVSNAELTLAPGQTTKLALSDGEKVVAGVGYREGAGTIIAVVSAALADATVVLH